MFGSLKKHPSKSLLPVLAAPGHFYHCIHLLFAGTHPFSLQLILLHKEGFGGPETGLHVFLEGEESVLSVTEDCL